MSSSWLQLRETGGASDCARGHISHHITSHHITSRRVVRRDAARRTDGRMEEEEEPAGTSRTRTDAVGFDKGSENEDPQSKAGTHGRRGLGISSPASPAPPSPKYDSAALSGYLLRERRNSVSEYCQPLKLYLDVLVFLISFRNVHLMRQGYVQENIITIPPAKTSGTTSAKANAYARPRSMVC